MHFSAFLAFLICVIVTAAAPTEPDTTHPSPSTSPACRPYIKRQEWSAVSQTMRDSYIQAVLCLAKKPSRIGLNTTLYDDFTWVHMTLFDQTHYPFASFLPWHRYFVHIYEKALQDCGYEGNALYWDWAKDAADIGNAMIWTTGFGDETFDSWAFKIPNFPHSFKNISGNTFITTCIGGPYCISGPFASLVPAYSHSRPSYAPHSITRDIFWRKSLEDRRARFAQDAVDAVMKEQTFNKFQRSFYMGPHAAIHVGVGGDMPGKVSANDPLFFVHHTQVDRIWWLWQQANRTDTYDGEKYVSGPIGVFPHETFESEPAAVSDMLSMLGMAPDIPVSKVMSTETALLCYHY